MPRGGRRNPTPGGSYPNRSDLAAGPKVLAPTAAPGQPYGKAGQQLAAQRVIPMGSAPGGGVAPSASPSAPPPAPRPQPGSFGPLDRPTERPDEPVTAGAPFGPGPGPQGTMTDPTGDYLRALYQIDPNPDVRELLELHENGGY